jgi:hypothetical protein
MNAEAILAAKLPKDIIQHCILPYLLPPAELARGKMVLCMRELHLNDQSTLLDMILPRRSEHILQQIAIRRMPYKQPPLWVLARGCPILLNAYLR